MVVDTIGPNVDRIAAEVMIIGGTSVLGTIGSIPDEPETAMEQSSKMKLLEAKRAELLDSRPGGTGERDRRAIRGAPDLGDRALSTMTRDLNYRLSTGERDILKRIDAALDRIESETYGECLNCGKKVQHGASRRRSLGAALYRLPGAPGSRTDLIEPTKSCRGSV